MFVTISLTIFVLESLMPPVINIPGIKPGFANIVTLFLLVNTNKRSAFTVLIVRIILASIFAGQIMSLFYSLSGGILSLLAMSISKILYGHICKGIYLYSRRKSCHNYCSKAIYKSLYHQNTKIHNRLLQARHNRKI